MSSRMREKAKTARSVQNLLTIAKDEGIALTERKAAKLFDLFHPQSGELSNDELLSVSGGGCGGDNETFNKKFTLPILLVSIINAIAAQVDETVILLPAVSQ